MCHPTARRESVKEFVAGVSWKMNWESWKSILLSYWKVWLEGAFEECHFKEPLENLVEDNQLKAVAEILDSKLSLRRFFFGPLLKLLNLRCVEGIIKFISRYSI